MITWTERAGDKYLVTGVTVNGKRFKKFCANWHIAASINLYRGTKWLVRDGKRKKLQEVYN